MDEISNNPNKSSQLDKEYEYWKKQYYDICDNCKQENKQLFFKQGP